MWESEMSRKILEQIDEMLKNSEFLSAQELVWVKRIDDTMAGFENSAPTHRQTEGIESIYDAFKKRQDREPAAVRDRNGKTVRKEEPVTGQRPDSERLEAMRTIMDRNPGTGQITDFILETFDDFSKLDETERRAAKHAIDSTVKQAFAKLVDEKIKDTESLKVLAGFFEHRVAATYHDVEWDFMFGIPPWEILRKAIMRSSMPESARRIIEDSGALEGPVSQREKGRKRDEMLDSTMTIFNREALDKGIN